MKHYYFTLLFAVIALSVFSLSGLNGTRDWGWIYASILFMLLFPFTDKTWQKPDIFHCNHRLLTALVYSLILIITLLDIQRWKITGSTFLLAALPEEWFFRAYLLVKLRALIKSPWLANILTSVFFSLLHFPSQSWFALSIFFPSLVFGLVYQRTGNIILVTGLHTLANAFFLIYLNTYIQY